MEAKMIFKEFKKVAVFAVMATVAFSSGMVWAADKATAKEAEAMVKKGITYIKTNGKEKGYAEITNKNGQFTEGDLYLTVWGTDGKVWAHGANEKMVGKVLIDLKDVDGKEFVRERMELAKSKPAFWADYKQTNPVSKKVEPKSMYCEHLDESTLVCGGIYK
jgi:hypothetical protein